MVLRSRCFLPFLTSSHASFSYDKFPQILDLGKIIRFISTISKVIIIMEINDIAKLSIEKTIT